MVLTSFWYLITVPGRGRERAAGPSSDTNGEHTVLEQNLLLVGVDLGDGVLVAETSVLLLQGVGNGDPNTAGTTTSGETEGGVGAPVAGDLVVDDVGHEHLDVGSSDTLAQPGGVHEGGRDGPDLEVVGLHENLVETSAQVALVPLVKVLRLVGGGAGAGSESRVHDPGHALLLLVLVQHGQVVLEGVGDPLALEADVGDALVGVPVLGLGERLVDAVVKVLVVGEDDVAADIVQLRRVSGERTHREMRRNVRSLRGWCRSRQGHQGSHCCR